MAIATGRVGTEGQASWDKIKKLNNRGFEFISHGHSHTNLTDLSLSDVETELRDSMMAFRNNGMKAEFLAYPGNAFNDDIIKKVRQYFRGAVQGSNLVNYPPILPWSMRRYSVNSGLYTTITKDDGTTKEVMALFTLDELKAVVNEAVANCGWVIFMTHYRNNGDFYFNDDVKNLTVNLIQYAVESGCRVVTLGEGFEEYKNRMTRGTMYAGSHYAIGCNGSTKKYNWS